MKIKCIIVDDEPLAIAVIENYLSKLPDIEIVAKFENALDAFDILKKQHIDLIFLDIEMPNITGIDFLKSLSDPPNVIITSANKDYAIEGFELNVVDYIIKPLTFERLLKAINKLPEKNKKGDITIDVEQNNTVFKDDYIFVKENKKMVKIFLSKILYIESIKDYVQIFTERKKVITKQQLGYFEKKLEDKFIRIHKSYLVSTSKIESYSASGVEILNKELPIGRSYKEEVICKLNKIFKNL
ncbi:MAG: response regulator transcription factor [Bacteroidales bacterium]|nr:response regulator transcription factor [Bacteroidales bacterium]